MKKKNLKQYFIVSILLLSIFTFFSFWKDNKFSLKENNINAGADGELAYDSCDGYYKITSTGSAIDKDMGDPGSLVKCGSKSDTKQDYCYHKNGNLYYGYKAISTCIETSATPKVEEIPKPIVTTKDVNKILYAINSEATATASCNVTFINGVSVETATKVYLSKITDNTANVSCTSISRFAKEETPYYSTEETIGKTVAGNVACSDEVVLDSTASASCIYGETVANSQSVDGTTKVGTYCKAKYNNQIIFVDRFALSNTKVDSTTCDKTCKTTDVQTDVKETQISIKVCYDNSKGNPKAEKTLKSLFKCANGYTTGSLNKIYDNCATSKDKSCYITFGLSCINGVRPTASVTSSIFNSDNKGTIIIKGTDFSGSGLAGYYISQDTVPTSTTQFTKFDDASYTAYSTQDSAGTYYIWVKDNKGNISIQSFASIYDTNITTTLSKLETKDDNGNVVAMNAVDPKTAYYNDGVIDSKYVLLSNSLKNNKTIAGFDSLSMGYEVNVKSNKLAVYATLTSTDSSYVTGYEPRTVSLNYGRNIILIKIINKDGRVRTYTIIANREDDRTSNNLLSNLTISAGSIEFDPYTSNYDVEVPKNTKTVSINGTLASSVSSFVKGYEPRKITLTSDVTSAVLKTVSEAGITRSYVLTFIKKGAEDTNNISTSTYLSSLTIAGTDLNFEKDTYNYSVSVPYVTETLQVYAFPESGNANVTIEGDSGLKVGPNSLEITVKNGSKTKVYNVTVIRKEDGLGISSDTTLNSLSIKDYNINFKPDVLDYTVKIKREKTLVITATPTSDRSDVYMYGNNDLTGFSTVRVKVIAENGKTQIYSIDIQKAAYNKALEITLATIGVIVIIGGGIIIVVRRKRKQMKEYMGE